MMVLSLRSYLLVRRMEQRKLEKGRHLYNPTQDCPWKSHNHLSFPMDMRPMYLNSKLEAPRHSASEWDFELPCSDPLISALKHSSVLTPDLLTHKLPCIELRTDSVRRMQADEPSAAWSNQATHISESQPHDTRRMFSRAKRKIYIGHFTYREKTITLLVRE